MNMESKKYISPRTGRTFVIEINDEGDEIEVTEGHDVKGTISLIPFFAANNEETFYITTLALERCKGEGAGRACLLFHKEVFGMKLLAAHDEDRPETGTDSDGSYLVGDGSGFIARMRAEGIVEW